MSNFEQFVGTRPVSEQHAFDTEALTAWLSQHVQGFAGPLRVEMFKGGQSNPTYKLITPGRSYVMRAKPGPVAKLLPSAHAIEREYAVMGGLAGTDVPVPRMLALCEDESVIGRAFYIMEFMQGRVLWDQSLPGMTPAERAAIYDEMNRVIAALHSVKFAEWLADEELEVSDGLRTFIRKQGIGVKSTSRAIENDDLGGDEGKGSGK